MSETPQTSVSPPELGKAFSLAPLGLLLLALASTASVLIVGMFRVDKYKDLGAWGDFVGGLLNPVLTFITFLAVLLTLLLQRRELALTRDEMERSADALEGQSAAISVQNFETTFFELLKLHNSIVNAIDLVDAEGRVTRGRDAFRVFYSRLTKIYRKNKEQLLKRYSREKAIEIAYFIFWRDALPELGHYYRFLFNFVRFLDESPHTQVHHARLLRSQLSDQELLLLFYNNLSRAGRPFQNYASKFELFDNLPVARVLEHPHAKLIDPAAFGRNPMEFRPYVPANV